MAESVSECIERLSALPPRKRLEAFREIADPEFQRMVDEGMPPTLQTEMLAEALVDNLNRNVRDDIARREGKKPGRAA